MNNEKQVFPKEGSLYIVAEVASAHQGQGELCFRLINEVSQTGADAVKFQLYKYDELATPYYKKFKIFQRIFFTSEEQIQFIELAYERGLDVWIDIFDRWGLEVARGNRDKISVVKIPPTAIMDIDLVKKILELNLPTAVGVGGHEDKDVDFVFSKLKGYKNPILLMYGFQGFPTPEKDATLARIKYLKNKYAFPIGFADHVDADSDMALRMPEYAFFSGASVIEKHITVDRAAKGLDYYSALEPQEFKKMIDNLKQCIQIYGTDQITTTQKEYLVHATRVTTVRPIKKGEILFLKDIKFRRTDNTNALFPNEAKSYFPAVALHDLSADIGVGKEDIRKAVVGAIVVCRMKSKRLPHKALLRMNGIPVIERCLLNTLSSNLSAMTVLATSTHPDDNKLKEHTLNGKVKFFQGSKDDPASRMLGAAEHYGLDIIIRVTGDSPLISYEMIDFLLESHFLTGADFSYIKDAPLGTKPEVLNKMALAKLKSMTNTDRYSEYLSLYFKNNPDIFLVNEVSAPENFKVPKYRLGLDYPEDYDVLKKIFEGLKIGREPLPLSSVIKFLKKHPKVAAINVGIKPKYEDGEFAKFINSVTKIKISSSKDKKNNRI